jgi:hypothetical protein
MLKNYLNSSKKFLLDMLQTEERLEGGAGRRVHHLLADVREIGRPHDENVLIAK